jgi:hypothetical protein
LREIPWKKGGIAHASLSERIREGYMDLSEHKCSNAVAIKAAFCIKKIQGLARFG